MPDRARLEDTIATLQQHRALLEKAQEVAHVGSWAAELDGSERLAWSRETHRIFGVAPDTFAGTTEAFFAMVHPEDRPAVRAAIVAARTAGPPYDVEHRIVHADGTVRWVHEQADIVRDAQGAPVRMVGTVQDVTDRRQLEEQLRQSQKMEAIGRLAGGIAHDLNNALTAIAGYADLALNALEPGHPARTDVEEIRRGAERAAAVTRQLLVFSRKALVERRAFDLNETVRSITRLLARLLGPNIEVRADLARSLPAIVGDPAQLEQAIVNLAVNARDAMPEGGRLTLSTAVEALEEATARTHVSMPPGSYVVLRVSDTGHGMSPDTQARMFEPFFTTKPAGKGTGLGLSMVYGTVQQSGGFIVGDSAVDRGTTFRLYFPAAGAADPLPVDPPHPDPPSTVAAPIGRKTVLVAEDEPAVRNLVASALRNEGYDLLIASSAEEALRLGGAHTGSIDLLLTDAIMPGRSGLDLANALTAARPGLPVIVMSGYTEESLSVSGMAQPVTLLPKPFTPRDLRQRIRDVLDR